MRGERRNGGLGPPGVYPPCQPARPGTAPPGAHGKYFRAHRPFLTHARRSNPTLMPRLSCLALLSLAASIGFSAEIGVRIRFGLTDTGNTDWSGKVSVSPGQVERIDGWRFEDTDQVIDNASWTASTRPLSVRRGNAAKKAKAKGKKAQAAGGMLSDNGVFLLLTDVTEQSVVKVEARPGSFEFRLADIPYGKVVEQPKDGVDIERVAASRPLARNVMTTIIRRSPWAPTTAPPSRRSRPSGCFFPRPWRRH